MNAKYIALGLALIATATVISGNKHAAMKNCMTEEAWEAAWDIKNDTMKECFAAAGITPPPAPPTGAPGEKHHFKPNLCFLECVWKKDGMIKDGNLNVEDFVKMKMKPEFQSAFSTGVQNCLTEKGLTKSYTVTKDDECKGLEGHVECIKTTTEGVCMKA